MNLLSLSLSSSSELYRDPRFFNGIELFNKREWYSSHDIFESLWMEVADPEKIIIQGFLQIAVGYLHLERNNLNGAIVTMSEGLMTLEFFRFNPLGINIDYLYNTTLSTLISIQDGQNLGTVELPSLRICPEIKKLT
uniref:DUF309 domain-containing protein n=1 Tax=Paulinella longichromatophora TaxID=1708747 RepID=A0A2H4ZNI6_9EUKA|nr:hypothetical protein PLO_070 [Paulinella longichromatophora]